MPNAFRITLHSIKLRALTPFSTPFSPFSLFNDMQGVVLEGLGMSETFFYFEIVTEGYSAEESIHLLKHSPSLRIAKNGKNYSSSVINKYPEYKELL